MRSFAVVRNPLAIHPDKQTDRYRQMYRQTHTDRHIDRHTGIKHLSQTSDETIGWAHQSLGQTHRQTYSHGTLNLKLAMRPLG